MKYLISLLKKDFFLSKKMTLLILLGNLAAPPLIFWFAGLNAEEWPATPVVLTILFYFLSYFSIYLTLAALSSFDTKYAKVDASLCSTPYLRSKLVLARYAYLFCVYLVCLVIHVLWRLLLPQAGMLTVLDVCLSLLLSTVITCIFLPVRYRFSPNVATTFLIATYFAALFLLSNFFADSQPAEIGALLSQLIKLPGAALAGLALAAALAVFALSSFLSIRIYRKKDL